MKVAIIKDDALDYDRNAPFHPPERYPSIPLKIPGRKINAIAGSESYFIRSGWTGIITIGTGIIVITNM